MLKQMKVMQAWLSQRSRQSRRRHPSGYILATVIGLSVVLAVGIASVSIRAAAERAGSLQSTTISLSQSAAEIGLERLYAVLNNGPYQSLANQNYDRESNRDDWETEFNNINSAAEGNSDETRVCGLTPSISNPATSLTELTAGTTTLAANNGGDIWWELERYTRPDVATSTPATVVMRGGLGSSRTASSNRETTIEKRYSAARGQPILGTEIGNAALFAGSIDLGNNDVLSSDSTQGCANVYCRDCQASQGPNSTVEGAVITLSDDVPFPEPKIWPTTGATAAAGYYDRIGQTNPFGTPPILRVSDFANTDSNNFINIRVNNVPPELKVINNTCGGATSNPVRLPDNDASGCKRVAIYFEGNITGSVRQIFADVPNPTFLPYPENLVFYGLPSSATGTQNITLSGNGDKIQGAVVIAPKARAGINGGPPKSRVNPDVYGPLYVGVWDRSNSNNAEIVVPYDMFDRLEGLIPNLDDITSLVTLRNAVSWRKGGQF